MFHHLSFKKSSRSDRAAAIFSTGLFILGLAFILALGNSLIGAANPAYADVPYSQGAYEEDSDDEQEEEEEDEEEDDTSCPECFDYTHAGEDEEVFQCSNGADWYENEDGSAFRCEGNECEYVEEGIPPGLR